jgi:long-chain acyl-CoA synthetase
LRSASFPPRIIADAAEVSGVKIDDKISVGGTELLLNGAGMRTRLIIKVYIGALYLPQKASTAQAVLSRDQQRRFSLHLQRDVDYEQFARNVARGLAENNSQAELDAIKPQINEFIGIFASIGQAKAGQVVAIDLHPGHRHADLARRHVEGHDCRRDVQPLADESLAGRQPGSRESLKKALLGAG